MEEKMAQVFEPNALAWPITVVALVLVGSYCTVTQISKPVIPQGSAAFKPPFKAMNFLADRGPAGNLFNDAQFGDLIVWYHPTLKVFIDTRYDMYGEHLIADYRAIMSCAQGWQQLLDHYQIQFVFVAPASEIAVKIAHLSTWGLVYKDDQASIYQRKSPASPPVNVDVHQ